jgi:trigger factor
VRESLLVEVGSATAMPELDRTLLGMAPGESRTFETTYPAEHSDPALAGKAVPFRVTVLALRDRKLPPLDDELARAVGVADLAALRAEIRDRLIEVRKDMARREQEQEVLAQLLARNTFAMPDALVSQETESRLRRALQRLASQGLDLDTARIDWDTEERRAREGVERDLRVEYLLELVAREKGIEVQKADLDAEIEMLAKHRKTSQGVVRGELQRSKRMSELEATLRRRRVLDLLRSGATISTT